MVAGYLRAGWALTVKLACWPTRTAPTSASSTFTCSLSLVRSSARVNRVTACSEAATALPGSTVRVSTTPSMGERMEPRVRLVASVDTVAWADTTLARALASLATARSSVARAVASSACEGTCPPDRRATSSSRARLPVASLTVATACTTAAWAAFSAARERATWSCSLEVSSSTSTWPFLTWSFTSTSTRCTVPDSSLPMLTARVGCKVPLALTDRVSLPRPTGSVTYTGACLLWLRACQYQPPATASTSKAVADHTAGRCHQWRGGASLSWANICAVVVPLAGVVAGAAGGAVWTGVLAGDVVMVCVRKVWGAGQGLEVQPLIASRRPGPCTGAHGRR